MNNIIDLDPEDIDMGVMCMSTYGISQVRVEGIDPTHVDNLVKSIEGKGQQVPIQIEPKLIVSEGSPAWDLTNGGHRMNAIKIINKSRAKANLPPIKVRAEILPRFTDPNTRLLEQMLLNEVDPVKPNQIEDLVSIFQTLIQNGVLGNLSAHDDKEVLKRIKKYVDKTLPCRKGTDTIAKKVFKTLGNHQKKIRSYTSDGAAELFDKLHSIKSASGARIVFEGSGVKNEHALYMCDSLAHLGNTIGLGMLQCSEKTIKKYIVVAWLKGIGKNERDIMKFREGMVRKVNGLNKNFRCISTKSKKIVDELIFLPQVVISGQYPTENQLIKAKIK